MPSSFGCVCELCQLHVTKQTFTDRTQSGDLSGSYEDEKFTGPFHARWRHAEEYTAHYVQWIFPPPCWRTWRRLIVSRSLPWHAGLVSWMFWLDSSWSQPQQDADRLFHPPTPLLFHRRRKKTIWGISPERNWNSHQTSVKISLRCLRNTCWLFLCSWTGLFCCLKAWFASSLPLFKAIAINKPTNWLQIHS